MAAVHPDAELAPRDVVARGIAAAMRDQGGEPVLLDATGLDPVFLVDRFPGLTRATRAAGFDWTREGVPVAPAAHYWMGGIATDAEGRTSLPGLLAVGEVACTGVHGANRLASNSLLEGLVFAVRAADALDAPRPDRLRLRGDAGLAVRTVDGPGGAPHLGPSAHLRRSEDPGGAPHPRPSAHLLRSGDPVATVATQPAPVGGVRGAAGPDTAGRPDDGGRASRPDRTDRPEDLRRTLQGLMTDHVGLLRDAAGLAVARRGLDHLAVPAPATVRDHEDRALLDLARLVARAAEARTESRGAHARTDHPETDPTAPASLAWVAAPATARAVTPQEVPA
jgi:L-aspartate oxidase